MPSAPSSRDWDIARALESRLEAAYGEMLRSRFPAFEVSQSLCLYSHRSLITHSPQFGLRAVQT